MQHTVKRVGCTMVYDVYGEPGAQTVVLLHGYGVDGRMWQSQLDALRGYRVLVPDVRGHGRSRPCEGFTIPTAADDVKAMLERENCKTFLLAGLSMGGYITQEFAFRHGGAMGYFIVGATPIFLPCYTRLELLALKWSPSLFALYPWNTLKNAMAKACAVTQTARAQVLPLFDAMTKPEFVAAWRGVANAIHVEQTMRFDAPLLVACGDHDKTGTIMKCLKEWEPAYARCHTMLIPNAAHLANMDAPEVFNETLAHFAQACFAKKEQFV